MRKEEERFRESSVMEGMISFRAVIKSIENNSSDRIIERVYIDIARKEKLARSLSYIRAMSSKHNFPIEYVSSEVINEITVGTSHGGVVALTTERTIPVLNKSHLEACKNGFFVMLCGIEDPYNFGYALRSLYASGADGVILNKRNWMSAAGVVCRASAGASELMPSYIAESDEEVAKIFKECGYRIVCTGLEGSEPMWEGGLERPLLLAIGGEKRGISRSLLDLCDTVVRIDYAGAFSGSLSAASAASILAYEVMRNNAKR